MLVRTPLAILVLMLKGGHAFLIGDIGMPGLFHEESLYNVSLHTGADEVRK